MKRDFSGAGPHTLLWTISKGYKETDVEGEKGSLDILPYKQYLQMQGFEVENLDKEEIWEVESSFWIIGFEGDPIYQVMYVVILWYLD